MKKIFLTLITALITILSLSAQNTYNMVIEMNDGTKINIGPNDIKNMSFVDGNLTVSGESIDDIKKEIAELKKVVNEQKSCECSNEIETLKKEIANLNTSEIIAMINVLQMQIKSLTDEVAALKGNGGNNDSQGGGNDDQDDGTDDQGDESDNQGGNQGNVVNPSDMVGIWLQYHEEYNTRYYDGIKLDANGEARFYEWNLGDTMDWNKLRAGKWYVNDNVLTFIDPNGKVVYSSSFTLSNDGKTLTLTGYYGSFTKQ